MSAECSEMGRVAAAMVRIAYIMGKGCPALSAHWTLMSTPKVFRTEMS